MRKIINRILESTSLTLFLVYIHLNQIESRSDWLAPYLIAVVCGAITTLYLYKSGVILNRLLLGINLYFLSGLLGLIFDWDWLNQFYGVARAAAMLYWIIIVGLISYLVSPLGFLGLSISNQYSRRVYSALLLLATVIATCVANYFSPRPFLSEWLPFIFLFSIHGVLQKAASLP